MIRLLVVDDIASTRQNLQKLLGFDDDIEVVGTAGDGREAVEMAHATKPDIILMDVNMPVMDGIQATELLTEELSASPVIIMSVQGERDYLRRAMQAGAREFLIKPFSHDELVAAIRQVYMLEQKRGTYLADHAPAQTGVAATARGTEPGEVILVFAGKGGVGKTLLASNLAVALSAETSAKVALVDLDLQFGDVGVMLNIDHPRSITDLVSSGEAIEPEILGDVLAKGPGGISVLLAPLSPEYADLVTTKHIRNIMAGLRGQFDYVVVDTSCHVSEFNIELIELVQKILVVTSLTIPALKDAKLTLKVLESLGVDAAAIQLIVNRVDAYSDFNKEAIEGNLRSPVVAQLPFEPRVVGEAVTRGVPFVEIQPEAEISRAVRELVAQLVPSVVWAGRREPDKVKKRRSLFGR